MDDEGIDRPTEETDGPGPAGPATPPPDAPPTFVAAAPPAPSTFAMGGAGASGPPGAPGVPPVPPGPPSGEPGSGAIPHDPVGGSGAHPRPTPTLASMLAVGAGLLVTAGLFFLLGELDGLDQRGLAIGLSLLFLALGVALSTINRSNRAASAGVAISALAVVPLTFFLFADGDLFSDLGTDAIAGDTWKDLRGTASLVLAAAAALWLLGYVLNPARRFGFYLGAALVAIWLIPIINIQVSATEDLFSSFGSATTFQPIPLDPGTDPGFDSDFDSGTDPGSDFDSGFDSDSDFDPDADPGFDASFELPDVPDPSTKLGVVSLGFGAAYLALAAQRDRRGDRAMATAALAPAIFILLDALLLLGGHIGWAGIGLLAVVVGGAILATGLGADRRASAWIGVAVATFGTGWLVARPLDESPRAIGAALTLIGVVVALLVGATARRDEPGGASDPAAPAGPFGPGTAEVTTSAPASPSASWTAPAGGASPSVPSVPPSPPFGSPADHPPTGPSPTEERPPWSQPY